MYKASFRFGGDIIDAIYSNGSLMFLDVSTGILTTIEGLKISKQGVIKEFPDLEGNEDWKKISIERFKAHIKSFQTEEQVIDYTIEELKKYGYTALYKQRGGHRPKLIK